MTEYIQSRLRGDIDWSRWTSASSTRNWILNDPILDWLSMYHEIIEKKSPVVRNEIITSRGTSHHPTSFTSFIMSQGKKFETHLINYLFRELPTGWIVDIGGELNARSQEKFEETIQEMKKGTRIIHSGVLRNYYNKTYGIPDLLIRSDVFGDIFNQEVISPNERCKRAPLLNTSYHYRVVDIKFCTLKLSSDGVHLLNCGSIPAYKSQLFIYNQALSVIQGYDSGKAYILGRGWKYTCKNKNYQGNDALDKLGVIDYHSRDKKYSHLTNQAIRWLNTLKHRGEKWSINTPVHKRKRELFPNMSNRADGKWHSTKQKIADQDGEISNVWHLGVKHRKMSHQKKIYSWKDPRFSTSQVGMKGKKIPPLIDKILETNRGSDLISPSVISHNVLGWRDSCLDLFVDFETVNNTLTDFHTIPNIEDTSMIFMIGLGRFNSQNRWIYKNWTANRLSKDEEKRVCQEMVRYITRLSSREEVDLKDIKVWHYSHAEKGWWNKAMKRNSSLPDLKWCDLLQLFHQTPITIKGCLGFGLKGVANQMFNHGMIGVTYNPEEHSNCLDGASAMVAAYRAQRDCDERETDLPTHTLIHEMIKYNEMDCRVVGEILRYLRNNH